MLHIQVSAGDESRMAGAVIYCMACAEVSRVAGDGDVSYGPRRRWLGWLKTAMSCMAGDSDVSYGQ